MFNRKIEAQIQKIFTSIFNKVLRKKNMNNILNNNSFVRTYLENFENSEAYSEFSKKFSEKITRQGFQRQKGLWRKYYEASKKLNNIALPKTYVEFEKAVYRKVVEENFQMIKSIPQEVLKIFEREYSKDLIEEVLEGKKSRGYFERELKKHGRKNAKMIARTETAKLQTSIRENASTDLGSVAYIWISSKDQRTRPSHKAMDKVVVFWRHQEQKPLLDNMRGNAGEFPNCRCDVQPIFDESDLTLSKYKVYNYNVDKIITLTKKELIDALKKGYLE